MTHLSDERLKEMITNFEYQINVSEIRSMVKEIIAARELRDKMFWSDLVGWLPKIALVEEYDRIRNGGE